jgi:hypothetical protein
MNAGPLEMHHGLAFARLCRWSKDQPVTIRAHNNGRSSYVLDECLGLYLKYSTNRMSPWQFSFSAEQQGEIAGLRREFEQVFLVLVCGFDGIASLPWEKFKRLLDDDFKPMEWIKASRKSGEQYTLTGSDVVASFKVPDSDYPLNIYTTLAALDSKEARGRHSMH